MAIRASSFQQFRVDEQVTFATDVITTLNQQIEAFDWSRLANVTLPPCADVAFVKSTVATLLKTKHGINSSSIRERITDNMSSLAYFALKVAKTLHNDFATMIRGQVVARAWQITTHHLSTLSVIEKAPPPPSKKRKVTTDEVVVPEKGE